MTWVKLEQGYIHTFLSVYGDSFHFFLKNFSSSRKYMILHILTMLFIRTVLVRDTFAQIFSLVASLD